MIIAVYSIKDLIYNNSQIGRFYKKIKREGWILMFIAVLSISFNYIKDKRSETRQDTINREKAVVDSLLQATQLELKDIQVKTKDTILSMVENTYLKSIMATNEALADYNLEITDSLKTVINKLEINALRPQLSLAPLAKNSPFAYITEENEEEKLNIKFNSFEGTSYNISLRCYFIDHYNNDKILYSGDLTLGNQFLTQNVDRTYGVAITNKNFTKYENILVFVTGTFTKDPEGLNEIPFDSSFRFNFKEKKLISKTQLDYRIFKNKLNIN